jgi:hypothetical protein
MRAPRKNRAGFTLLEVIIGAAVSMVVCAAAFAFAQHETRVLGLTSSSITMNQSSRSMVDYLNEDLRHAGAGVGYRLDGTFGGLLLGNYTVDGVAFSAQNSRVNVPNASNLVTDDLGMMFADGGRATISDYSIAGNAQVCAGSGITVGELAVLRSEDALAARTVRVGSILAAPCGAGACVGGCQTLNWTAVGGFTSDALSAQASYLGGQLNGGLKSVVWFVETTNGGGTGGAGNLRRAVFDGRTVTCTARNSSCGALMSENVDTLQFQVWRWDVPTASWRNVTAGPLDTSDRLRVDVELVVRSRAESSRPVTPITLRLETAQCVPNCTVRDRYERRVLRSSVEIRNSGRMRIR